jgi:tryptophan-rich sensory protein
MGILKSTLSLVGWLAVSFGTGWIGSQFRPDAWYESLAKPAWNPPNAVFGPVWSVLYALMGVAAWLVWRRAGFKEASAALGLFVVQLVLNGLWSYLFFGLHRVDLAFLEILVLWALILIVGVLFWREVWLAGALMLPYLVWVGIASVLNFALWRLNTGPLPK